ncbi:MAG: helix-turn-helix transcriptional regulator, partial [Candidatus Thorarchaeota archaeon]|nr:helix-turn-helix transcriptional regulator [Candidatus Thorarchaeota archaeon]
LVSWGHKMSTETPTIDTEEETPLFPEGLPKSKVRNYLPVTDSDIVESFLDPVRRSILLALRTGIMSIKKESREDTIEREDGTKITTIVVEEKKVNRFWMTVREIVKHIKDFIPELEVSKYNCYYHLPKLREQGLIEQHPEPEFDDEGNEISSKRGVYYRRTAKVFIVSSAKMSGETVELYMKLFEKGFEVGMTRAVRNRLEDLLVKQEVLLDDASGYLVAHLKEVDVDSTALSDLLTGMAYIFLSDNEEFLKIQRELKKAVLTPCCGSDTDMKLVCLYCGDPLEAETVLIKKIDGKNQSFCDDDCAVSFQKGQVSK